MAVLSGELLSGEAAKTRAKGRANKRRRHEKNNSRPNLLAISLPSPAWPPPMLLSAPNQNRHATQAMQIYKMVSPESGRAEEVVIFEKF